MNTYDTYCETPRCRNLFLQQAPDFDEAIDNLRRNGWSVETRPDRSGGVESHCPEHAFARRLALLV